MKIDDSAAPLLRGLAAATLLSLVLAGPAQAGDKDLATSQKKAPKPAVSAQAKLKADVKIQDPKDGPDQKKDVNEEAPGGPQPSLPGLTRDDRRSVKTSPGSKSSDPAQVLKDASTIRDGSTSTLLINETADKASQRPKFDNGFGETKQIDEKAVSDALAGHSGNPMKGLTGGGKVGGPLGDAAEASDSRSHGFGKDSISQGITNPTGSFQDGELKNKGKGNLAKDLGLNDRKVTSAVMGGTRFEEIDAISRGEDPGAGKPAGGGDEAKPPKQDKLICHNDDCSHSATVHPDGSVDVRKPDRTRETIQPDGSSVTRDKDGKIIDEQKAPDAGRPDPDSNHGTISKEEFLRQKLGDRNFQIKQAAKAGGTVNPDRGETGSGVARSGAVPSQQSMGHNLFGQPVDSGVRQGGSPSSGPNFNGNLGAIDPGPDATVNTGPGREQDRVGDTLGRVGTQTDLSGGRSSDEDDDDSDSTQSAKDQ
jgi:hypothetical protein